jgi:lipopolysaccharide export system protein LptA
MIFRYALVCLLAEFSIACAPGAEPGSSTVTTSGPAAPTVPLVPTVIESGSAEMVSTDKETTFTFRKGVSVTGTNMKITCDELVVIARRTGDPAATLGKQENFKSLIATGNVRILQNDREATCGRAAVYPGDDKVELTENPVVRSIKEGWTQSGPKMVLYRGQRRAVIEGTATERPKLVLPPLKDLGYEKDKKEKGKAEGKKAGEKPATESDNPPLTVPIPPPPK